MRIQRTRTGARDDPDPIAVREGSEPAAKLRPGTSVSPPTRHAAALHLWVVLSRAFGAVSRRAAADIERHGLTPGEFSIMEALYHKGPLLLGELQRKILVSSGGVTYLVDRLEKRGYVERRACPTDRRARYAALMPEGTALMSRIFPEHARAIEAAVSGLSRREQRLATELLRKLGLAASVSPDDGERVDGRRSQGR